MSESLSSLPPSSIGRRCGLVLSAGGARGAYQAGVLRAIGEIAGEASSPFDVITGVSAGAVNGAYLAARNHQFRDATDDLARLWETLIPQDVYRTGSRSLTRIGMGWLRDLTLGGVLERTHSNYLLDAAPLRRLLTEHVDFSQLRRNVREQRLLAAGFSVTNYATGTAVTFYDAQQRANWVRSNRLGKYAKINVEHIMASAALPFIFPPVAIGHSFFGDGALRMRSPLSAAIHLGAERLVAVSVRRLRTRSELIADNRQPLLAVTTANIAGVVLNAIFLDTLDADLERLSRINRTLKATRAKPPVLKDRLRVIPTLVIHPSVDLGEAAQRRWTSIPWTVRYLLRGLGADEQAGSDLLSYLAFHHDYTSYLVDRGYKDAMARSAEIATFLSAPLPEGDDS